MLLVPPVPSSIVLPGRRSKNEERDQDRERECQTRPPDAARLEPSARFAQSVLHAGQPVGSLAQAPPGLLWLQQFPARQPADIVPEGPACSGCSGLRSAA